MEPSQLALIADKACDCLVQLHRAQRQKKLNASGFLAAAAPLVKHAEAENVVVGVDASNGSVAWAVRELSKFFAGPHCPNLPTGERLQKLWRIQVGGQESLAAEMQQLGLTMGDVIYCAVRRAVVKYPGAFDTDVEDWTAHQNEVATLQQKLVEFDQQMRKAVSSHDLTFEPPQEEPSRVDEPARKIARIEASRGDHNAAANIRDQELEHERFQREYRNREHPKLSGPWLVHYRDISINDGEWPRKLLESMLSGDPVGVHAKALTDAVKAGAKVRTEDKPKNGKPIERKLPARVKVLPEKSYNGGRGRKVKRQPKVEGVHA